MANWGYVAIDKAGKEIKGSRDADTQEALTRDLKQQERHLMKPQLIQIHCHARAKQNGPHIQ